MLMVVVATGVLLSCPSLTTQLMLRLFAPAGVGGGCAGAALGGCVRVGGKRDLFHRPLIPPPRRRPGEPPPPATVVAGNAVLVGEVETVASQQAACDRHRRAGQR